ncbi:MAG: dipeptidase PepV [Clostridiales bacterium]|nr:dipeptidase PepV [Clostridiales bacterium]
MTNTLLSPSFTIDKDRFLADLSGLLAIESVRDDALAAPGAPFGPGPAAALAYMLDLADRDGFDTANIDGYAGRIAWGSGDEIVGILVHLDVVPATGHWTTPPFQATVRDGYLYARGAADDKGPAMAAYYALLALKEAGFLPQKQIHLILGTDEERDWGCLNRYFETEPMPDLGFSPDADFPLINGEKGMLTLCLTAPTPAADAAPLTFAAGERSNMVPDEARASLSLAPEAAANLKNRYITWLQKSGLTGQAAIKEEGLVLTLQGKSAHGAEPEAGINAATALARFLTEADVAGGPIKQWLAFISACLHQQTDGSGLGIDAEDPVMGAVTVNAGIVNFMPDSNRLIINIRYPRGVDRDRILAQVSALAADYGLQTSPCEKDKPVHYIPEDDPLVATLLAVYRQESGDETAQPLSIGGGTYARMMPRAVAYGPLFPGEDGHLHQPDEHIALSSLYRAVTIYADAIRRLTAEPDSL